MQLRYRIMRKANLITWVATLFLAPVGMPLVAQEVPARSDSVRKALNQPAPGKAAAGANTTPASQAGSAGTAAPKPQTPKPAPPTPSGVNPVPPAPKSASSSAPSSPAGPATASTKRASTAAAKSASSVTPRPKPTLGTAGVSKPAGSLNSEISPGPAGSSTRKAPKSKLVTATKSDAPKRVAATVIKPVAERENIVRRDPFAPLLGRETSGSGSTPQNLPPGKPGLLISSLRIDGIVSGPNGMIAIVSNAQDRVYFLREGDRLYDGQVEHITMDGISFHQAGKDPFGNAVEREVAKRLNSIPGEQQ